MELLPRAIALHRAGRLAEAEAIYRQILAADPNDAGALHLLGLIACQSARLEEAEDLMARALALEPGNAEFLINLGEVHRRQNQLAKAVAALRRAAELAPRNAFAHYNLAVALAADKQFAEAMAAYRQALASHPDFPEALNNLGMLLEGAGDHRAAVAAFERALALRGNYAEAANNLGLSLWNLHEHAAALAAFDRAVELIPNFGAAHGNRALVLRKLGRGVEAVEAYRKAAQLDPNSADVQRDMAMALSEVQRFDAAIAAARRAVELAAEPAQAVHCLGVILAAAARHGCGESATAQIAEAIAAYQRALALEPGVPEWEFELAVLRGAAPPAPPDAYVKSLFDEYAPRFEHHLVDVLHYDVPQKLLTALRDAGIVRAPSDHAATLDVLDLGAGTGLVGSLLRPFAGSLTAVDLSPKMIALAQGRRDSAGRPVYDRLITSHLLPALESFHEAFDLIVAADVFIYVGRLDDVLPAAARALRRNGALAFSLERLDPPRGEASDAAGAPGFDFHFRYRHSLDYIRGLAGAAGLIERAAIASHLRDDVPPGWVVILQRPAT